MFRIELYFTLVCTSTFKYFIDFVYRNQWPLGDILDKKFSYAIVLALLTMATEQFCNFHMHDWLRKRMENDCVELPRGLLAARFGQAISEFHDKPYYFYIKYVGF